MPSASTVAVLAALLAAAAYAGDDPGAVPPWLDPARILVVYDASWPDDDGDGVGDSLEVASYYAQRRGVPAGQLLGLDLTPDDWQYTQGQWDLFLSEMRDPITAWLDANDPLGVDTLLFCYGVPYQIRPPGFGKRSVDSALCVPYALGSVDDPDFDDEKFVYPYREFSLGVDDDIGHFDHALYDFEGTPLYLHARLDGISAEHAKALVDRALYAERHFTLGADGYTGRAYVDSRFFFYDDATLIEDYPFNYASLLNADKSIAYGRLVVEASGMPVQWEPWDTEIGEDMAEWSDGLPALAAPDTMLYGGWYNLGQYVDVWEWKSGAIACDLNSNSAKGLRNPNANAFLSQALQRNLTAGAGAMDEPFVNGHNRPEVLLAYALDGFPWSETAMVSDNAVKWMSLHLGDPLYRLDPAGAVPDATPPRPRVWLGADHASLELELPPRPGTAPDGAEVFRCDELRIGPAPGALVGVPLQQPDDRRLQIVAVPGPDPADAEAGTILFAGVRCVDPSANGSSTGLLHFVPGPAAPVTAAIAAEADVARPGGVLALRISLGATQGLADPATRVAVTVATPSGGFADVTAYVLSLAQPVIASRSGDQLGIRVELPVPPALRGGELAVTVTVVVGEATASATATVPVSS